MIWHWLQSAYGWYHHWIWLDFYVPLWPNIMASVVVGGVLWLKLHAMHKLHKAHFEWHKERDQDA